MACTLEHSQRIGELAGGRLDAAGAAELLAHLEGCRACSQELDLVADLLRAAPAARTRTSGRPNLRLVLGAVALAAAVAVLFFSLRPRAPERRLHDLARLTPPPVAGLVLRGEGAADVPLAEALEAFGARDYRLAAERLQALDESRPDGALTLFYLGVARLELGEHEPALAALGRAAELGTSLLVEQALWYRAQAHLALDQGAEARAVLRRLVELDGDFEPNARALLAELEPLLH